MTLHVIYETSPGSTLDLAATDHVRLPGLEVSSTAEEGATANSGIPVEDVGGALDIVGWHRVWLWESAESAGNQVIGTFYVNSRDIGRQVGPGEDQVVSSDRWWNVTMSDHNVLLSHRIVTGQDGDRPAETDIQRIDWLLGSAYLRTVGDSLGYINRNGAQQLDKADLRGQKAYDVLSECANQSNKNFHLIPVSPTTSGGAATYSLWYDYDWSEQYRSTLRLTNDGTEDRLTTFAVDPDMVLRRTPERVYSGVLVRYNGGEVYVQDTSTGNAFAFRDAVHHAVNLQSASTATARANRYLADADAEEDRITCRFVVPKEKVNLLREGQACEVKFSHLPGYTSYTWVRCFERTVRQLSDEFYEIRAELGISGGGSAVAAAANAMLYGPQDNNKPAGNNGTFIVNYDTNGDGVGSSPSGCPPSVLAGALAYMGASEEWTGITATGYGTVLVDSVGTISGSTAQETQVLTARILVNGATAYQVSTTISNASPHSVGWTWSMRNKSLTVVAGDQIQTQITISGMGAGDPLVIPNGAGNCLGVDAEQLWVRGTMYS